MLKKALEVLIGVVAVFLFAALGLSAPQAPTSDSGAALAAASASPTAPQAVVLRLIRFSGQARDVAGKPLTGVAEITFSLYGEQAAGEALWFETQTVTVDEQGRYTALLGAMHPDGLPLDLFTSGRAHWLGMQVGKLPEQPRALLVSVPYALKAADAETLGGKPASAFMPAQPEAGNGEAAGSAVGQGKGKPAGTRKAGTQAVTTTANYIPLFADSAGTLTNSGFYQDPVTGNIGLGTTNPELKLHVMGDILLGGGLSGPASTVLKVRAKWSSGRFGELSSGPIVASDTPGRSITFYTTPKSTGVLAEAMRITADGKVGIGTTTPSQGLDVAANINASGNVRSAQFISTALSGTPPVVVSSPSLVLGLNADLLDGWHASNFATLGSNNFLGDQRISGDLTLSGSINGGLIIQPNAPSPNLIGGATTNIVTGGVVGATIGGGGTILDPNRVTDDYGTVGGGSGNQAGNASSVTSDSPYATVGGGGFNTASSEFATVGGGDNNSAGGPHATVGGGYSNDATFAEATVGGGVNNTASGNQSTVGGGSENTASGNFATVSGGSRNIASGFLAMVPGGDFNTAQGITSFAAGWSAKANHDGVFVWADSTDTVVASTAPNQFIVRASGGVWFGTTSTPGNDLTAGRFLATSTGAYLTSGGTWTNASDRNLKEHFSTVDGLALLDRVANLPIVTWNYRAEPASTRHIGPMAQDFRAAFGLGEDDKHISTVDADGVALAAIQALYTLSLEKDKKIGQLQQELHENAQEKDQEIKLLTQELKELRAQLEQVLAKR